MSRHPSYGKPNKGGAKRNVLKRFERIKVLKEKKSFKEEASVFGLVKTKSS
jgi:small basic protein (TIGR04137 family)